MYDALAREHVHMEQDQLRRRLEAAARFPRSWEMATESDTPARRRWWPRPHRSAAR
jgi:hypothetical protein